MSDRLRSLVCFVLSLGGAAAILWPPPYAQLELLSLSFLLPLTVAGVACGALSQGLLTLSVRESALLIAGGFGGALMLRMGADWLGDPTLHSLWPIAVGIVAVTGAFGGSLGAGIVRLRRRPSVSEQT